MWTWTLKGSNICPVLVDTAKCIRPTKAMAEFLCSDHMIDEAMASASNDEETYCETKFLQTSSHTSYYTWKSDRIDTEVK